MPPRLIFWITLSSALLGALFGHAQALAQGGDAGGAGYWLGAVDGALIAGVLSSLEIVALSGAAGIRFRQMPFLIYLCLRSLIYLGVILIVLATGHWLMPIGDTRGFVVRRVEIAFSLGLAFGYNLLLGVNQLLGPGVLLAFVAGRYHRPRLEERVLLFIDMRGSTAIAERLGEARFLDFLNRFITDVSLAIAETGGEIHKYVGDEVIATWAPGAADAGADSVRACFAALDRLAAHADAYERDFGFRADFRVGLHYGPVVVGELGYLKKEIALIGDTMNTAARIQQACRDTGHRVLASAALIERIAALPAGIACRALGPLALRGKEHALELFALEAAR